MAGVGPVPSPADGGKQAGTKKSLFERPAADHLRGGVGAARAHPEVFALPRPSLPRRVAQRAKRRELPSISGGTLRERRIPHEGLDPDKGTLSIMGLEDV